MSHVPGFRSWLRAFMLTICFIVLGVCSTITYESMMKLSLVFPDHSLWFLCMWGVLTLFVFPLFTLSHVYQFFWGDPDPKLPKWMPSFKSQMAGLGDYLVCLTSLGICTGIACIYLWATGGITELYGITLVRPFTQQETQVFLFGFFFISAHLYHLGKAIQGLIKRTWITVKKVFRA
ncbi:hypothetical protein PCC7424_0139 [Gloeothece citriformis PCC 7424]|uniref:Uncharacterized protein n=1 Tax=Gloeothece citriformis (strain PCC 7424) TaxID=65393 RepID=B7K9C6_GLOC7|nr:hypothetical protein [Gloeothece citriformis]ACK68609.1 hypothetical protein PCC7424_0139 [Gloeothece citriformis PCC 7424]